MPFTSFSLSAPVLEGVKALGYEQPTPIQREAIPLIMAGRDVIGSAQTGTGKTAAFALPILSKLGQAQKNARALVIEPTRELANQVESVFEQMARFTSLKAAIFYGGVGYTRQREALRHGLDVIIATPGRLLDLMRQGACPLDKIEHVVLDEADRLLDMGFLPDVKAIVQRTPTQRQTCLFSATIPPEIESLIQWAMRTPVRVEIGARRAPAETVRHVIYPVAENQKTDLLIALLEKVQYQSVIVFCRTKHRADRIGHLLKLKQHRVAVLHSNRTQGEREHALRGFREGRYEALVATDIASRGLDILNVSHVINFDVPQHPEDYVHRIGRTGRAENFGDAFTLMVAEDATHVDAIERFISQKIPRVRLEGFVYNYTALFDEGKRGVPSLSSRRVRAVRVFGGYHIGPSHRRRR